MLIIGCGYIGRALGVRSLLAGQPVTGLVSSLRSSLQLDKIGISSVVRDLDQPAGPLPLAGHPQVFYCAPPPPDGVHDPRISLLLEALITQGHTPRIVYISTTGVYGDCQGEWVDETRPIQATTDRARRRADAETKLLDWSGQGGGEVIILRVAGIYGPGRLPLERLRSGSPMLREAEAPWSNRIHAEDLVSVCLAAMERGQNGQVYNVSDGTPGNMAEYFNTLADLVGLDRPPAVSLSEARKVLPAGLLSYLQESRRIDNRKMLQELGVVLRYATLAEGLAASL